MKLTQIFIFIMIFFNINTYADRPRIWSRIPKFFVYDKLKTFLDEHQINNCFEFRENSDYLKLKCWKDNKLTDVDITINPGKRKKHFISDLVSIVI